MERGCLEKRGRWNIGNTGCMRWYCHGQQLMILQRQIEFGGTCPQDKKYWRLDPGITIFILCIRWHPFQPQRQLWLTWPWLDIILALPFLCYVSDSSSSVFLLLYFKDLPRTESSLGNRAVQAINTSDIVCLPVYPSVHPSSLKGWTYTTE